MRRRPWAKKAFEPTANATLKAAVKAARKVLIAENAIKRAIDFARQGYTAMDVREYDTDWDSEAYLTVSGQNATTRCA